MSKLWFTIYTLNPFTQKYELCVRVKSLGLGNLIYAYMLSIGMDVKAEPV